MALRATKVAEVPGTKAETKALKKKRKDEPEDESSDSEDELLLEDGEGLSAEQVESLLSTLCEGTDLAHLELTLPGFKLRVKRSLATAEPEQPVAVAAAPVPPPVAAPVAAPAAVPAGAAPATASEEPESTALGVLTTKVGLFRRGRYVKGKRVGKGPMVAAGDQVKKGQVLGFVDQLGTHWPVESPQSGEVLGFLVEDGDPVEYNQAVVEISPFFGGHIIGDKKYR